MGGVYACSNVAPPIMFERFGVKALRRLSMMPFALRRTPVVNDFGHVSWTVVSTRKASSVNLEPL